MRKFVVVSFKSNAFLFVGKGATGKSTLAKHVGTGTRTAHHYINRTIDDVQCYSYAKKIEDNPAIVYIFESNDFDTAKRFIELIEPALKQAHRETLPF